ncbi:type VI immunity family protein [Burkholderia ubonensis]|uniref:DUF3396 domain-containing protein n=1 Tax=Burkholderia ubonensis subsp. mesacidophila TaxID=265293 RepID=A0A2A4FKQ7_9BURK|nr:type VI immunity family protein [Burkholderia ubonensis]PCE33262.1 hypothetical protein BZL54_05985 [Burkholderia ubonensis subsp. mesacidophila]
MKIPVDDLSYEADGVRLVSPCLWLEIFLEYAEGPEILDFYQKARDALGDGLTHYDLGSGRRKRVSGRSETLVPTWCANPAYSPGKQYFILMSGAEEGATSSELVVEFWPRSRTAEPPARGAYPYSAVACAIPLDHPLVVENRLIDWIKGLEILSKGTFISGSCGIGLNFPINFPTIESSREATRHVASAIRRYPGLDVAARMIGVRFGLLKIDQLPGSAKPSRRTFLKRVNWLSFVNEKQVERLSAPSSLEAQLHQLDGIRVHGLSHGLLIEAGGTPKIGDSAQGDFVPVYQSVAHLLRPARLESIDGGHLSHVLDDQAAADWLGAFDTPQ